MGRVKDELIGLEDAGVEDVFVDYDTQDRDDCDLDNRTAFMGVYGDLTYNDWF